LAIPGRSRFAGPSAGGSRLGLLLSSTVHHHRVVGLMRRLAIPRRSPLAALAGPLGRWLAPLLVIPRRSPRFAWGPRRVARAASPVPLECPDASASGQFVSGRHAGKRQVHARAAAGETPRQTLL